MSDFNKASALALVLIAVLTQLISSSSVAMPLGKIEKPLEGKVICIDPGHGGTAATDSYRVGPTGEREEWINLRVGTLLGEMLEQSGAKVIYTRTTDTFIPLAERSKIAVENKVDLFISIHHNATADPKVNFPIIYFHGSAEENKASVDGSVTV